MSMSRPFPKQLVTIGWFVVVPSLLLALEQTWEKTILTWNSGLQMIGFTLIHTGIGIPLYLVLLGGVAWILAVAIFVVLSRSFGGTTAIALAISYALSWGLLIVPYGFWQRVFVEKLVQTPRAAEFVIDAAARGDLKTVKAFLSAGISVNATDRSGGTPLHAAAVGGQPKVAEYLIAQGANVNAINRYGNSPLEYASSEGKDEVAKLLSDRGAQRIRGTAEQRERVASEIVREDLERANRNDVP